MATRMIDPIPADALSRRASPRPSAADVAWSGLIAAAFAGSAVTDSDKWRGRLLALGLGMSVNLILERVLQKK